MRDLVTIGLWTDGKGPHEEMQALRSVVEQAGVIVDTDRQYASGGTTWKVLLDGSWRAFLETLGQTAGPTGSVGGSLRQLFRGIFQAKEQSPRWPGDVAFFDDDSHAVICVVVEDVNMSDRDWEQLAGMKVQAATSIKYSRGRGCWTSGEARG